MPSSRHTITLIPGDGIGPEVTEAVVAILDAAGAGNAPLWASIAVTGGVGIIVAIVVNSVIGWLAWWWMAHAMRGAAPVAAG